MPKETNSTFLPPRILGKRLVTAEHLKTQKAYDQYQKYYEKYTDTQKQEVDKYKEECIKVQKIIETLTLKIKQDIKDIDFLKLHARAWTISNSNILQELQQIINLQNSNQKSNQKKEMSDFSNQPQAPTSNTKEVLTILASIEKDYPEHITIPLHNAITAIITLEQQLDNDRATEDHAGYRASTILQDGNHTVQKLIKNTGTGFDEYVEELKQKALSTLVEKQYTSSQAPDKRERYWWEFFVCLITLGFMYPASNFLPNSPRGIQKVSDGLKEEGFLPQENRKSAVYSENFRSSTINSLQSTPPKKSEKTSPKKSLTR